MLLAKVKSRWHRNEQGRIVRSSLQPRLSLDETVPRYSLQNSCRSIRLRSAGPSVTLDRCRDRPPRTRGHKPHTQTLAQGNERDIPVNILSGNLENIHRQTTFYSIYSLFEPESLSRALLHPSTTTTPAPIVHSFSLPKTLSEFVESTDNTERHLDG